MNDETKEALKKSIKHWEENLEKAKQGALCNDDIDGDKCALCGLFWLCDCEGCPVKDSTGEEDCKNTPYFDVDRSLDLNETNEALIRHVEKELEFLKGLQKK